MLIFLIVVCWLLIVSCLITHTMISLIIAFWLFVVCFIISEIRRQVEPQKQARQEANVETAEAKFFSW
jgi:O-antigen ligase